MGFLFAVRAKSPVERGLRAVGMVLVVFVVIWAFWKNNETVVERLQQTQPYWDETELSKNYIKSFARDFAKSMENDFGIKARIQIRKGELSEPNPQDGMLLLAISPSTRQVKLRINPMTDTDQQLITAIENGHFDEYWDSGWEPSLESALVIIWNHYSGETVGFNDAVADSSSQFNTAAQGAAVVDETGQLSEEDIAFIGRFIAGLDSDFGQETTVHVFEGEVSMPQVVNRAVFIGLSPSRGEVVVALPPLVQRALPAGFESQLMTEHFPQYFESGDWQLGLKTALIKIWKGLAGEDDKLE